MKCRSCDFNVGDPSLEDLKDENLTGGYSAAGGAPRRDYAQDKVRPHNPVGGAPRRDPVRLAHRSKNRREARLLQVLLFTGTV